MKLITLLFTLFIFSCQSLLSQVKRTYKDVTYQQTTVVVKDKNATDQEVLNNNLDLDDYGMDQVIRITTEIDQPTPPLPLAEQDIKLDPPAELIVPVQESNPPASSTTEIFTEKGFQTQEVPTSGSSEKTERPTTAGSSTSTKSAKHKKSVSFFKRKVKKRKRVRSTRKVRCYQF